MRHERLRFLTAIILVLAFMGCASSTPARIAYNTIDGAVDGAQAAMKAFNERYQAGLQTEEDRTRALAAYADFQTTARLARQLATDITQKASAITVASDATAALLDLLAKLLPKKTAYYPSGQLAFGGA